MDRIEYRFFFLGAISVQEQLRIIREHKLLFTQNKKKSDLSIKLIISKIVFLYVRHGCIYRKLV